MSGTGDPSAANLRPVEDWHHLELLGWLSAERYDSGSPDGRIGTPVLKGDGCRGHCAYRPDLVPAAEYLWVTPAGNLVLLCAECCAAWRRLAAAAQVPLLITMAR